jgi:tryptophanyl-tRNA synthetase
MTSPTTIPNQTARVPNSRARVLSGMRPTGRLHLGNYMGALYNWVKLQHEYECYFFIADWHALTTDYADTVLVQESIRDVAIDFLAAGLAPELIFVQSDVKQHAELDVLLGNITPVTWLERVPTYKDQQEELKEKDLATYGFLGYPLLQSADILLYKPEFVPVGQDQAAHVEITREIARRFNHIYGAKSSGGNAAIKGETSDKEKLVAELRQQIATEILPEPKVLLTPSPKLPGLDGRKMSKSYNNAIYLSDPEPDVRSKLKTMVTDPARVRRTDPGNPDVCPVFDLHKVFSTETVQQEVREGCTTAGIGCIQCKGWLADAVVHELEPMQERRAEYSSNDGLINDILDQGAFRAQLTAEETMRQVRSAMGLRRR